MLRLNACVLAWLVKILLLILAPILYWQGVRAKNRILRLPEASGEKYGMVGDDGSYKNLLLIGESTVAGVGVNDYQQSLAYYLARELANQTEQGIGWHAVGKNGTTAKKLHQTLLAQGLARAPDVVVIVLGVNDTKGLSSIKEWQSNLRQIVVDIRDIKPDMPIVFTGVPNINDFPALPNPLRFVLGVQSRVLDKVLCSVCDEFGVSYCEVPKPSGDHYYAQDGFHPSEAGYQAWAKYLAPCVKKILFN